MTEHPRPPSADRGQYGPAIMSLCHLLPAPDARVVALRNNVRQAVVDDCFDLDVWIALQQLRELRHQNGVNREFGCADPYRAGRLFAELRYCFEFGKNLLKPGRYVL